MTQQVKKESVKFWNRRQNLYMSILFISSVILVTAAICVSLLKEKPISRSFKEKEAQHQSLKPLSDHQFEAEVKLQQFEVDDMLNHTIHQTLIPVLDRILDDGLLNTSFVQAQ